MADKPLKVHGVPQPKGKAFLEEVRVDAARNAIENLKEQQAKREFEAAKARGITVEEIVSKGKQDLGVEEVTFESEAETTEPKASNDAKKGGK